MATLTDEWALVILYKDKKGEMVKSVVESYNKNKKEVQAKAKFYNFIFKKARQAVKKIKDNDENFLLTAHKVVKGGSNCL